jgi:hypothetical protein
MLSKINQDLSAGVSQALKCRDESPRKMKNRHGVPPILCKRELGCLNKPILKVARSGEYEAYIKRRVSAGVPDGQFKMLKLNPDFDFQKNFEIEWEFVYELKFLSNVFLLRKKIS